MKRTEVLVVGVIAVLGISIVATYVSDTSEISSLDKEVNNLCASNEAILSSYFSFANNATRVLGEQIQSDETLISTLNSTRPSGYQNMIAIINSQISQDSPMIASFDSLTKIGPSSLQVMCSSS